MLSGSAPLSFAGKATGLDRIRWGNMFVASIRDGGGFIRSCCICQSQCVRCWDRVVIGIGSGKIDDLSHSVVTHGTAVENLGDQVVATGRDSAGSVSARYVINLGHYSGKSWVARIGLLARQDTTRK